MRGGRRRRINLVEAAVDIAGGVSAVAGKLGVSRQAVYNWIAAGHMMDVTYRYVAGLSKLSKIPIEQLTRKPQSDPTP
ncbi:MAG: YdaS family helix-turn-helix protein [Candidatus Binataceae bacterium]